MYPLVKPVRLLDLTVGVAAEYNSACVNTLRRPRRLEHPGHQKILVTVFFFRFREGTAHDIYIA